MNVEVNRAETATPAALPPSFVSLHTFPWFWVLTWKRKCLDGNLSLRHQPLAGRLQQ